jgi:MYXO-CTERM domain-containing protein
VSTSTGGYAWAYWPDPYSPPGEDISHAAVNVGFGARAARSGVVFGDAHLRAFAIAAFDQVYIDTATTYDHVGGSGATNGGSYRAQFGRWLVLDAVDPRIHSAVRATLDPYPTTTSGSVLLGFALLAATDQPQVPHRFYVADWEDLGDRRRATAYGANILIRPRVATRRYLVPVRYRTSRRTLVQQWDGDAYHTVAKLAPTGSEGATAMIPYDPSIYFDYADGVLFQFDDAFVAGAGIEVWNSETGEPPLITSIPELHGVRGVTYGYAPTATGDAPIVYTAELPERSSTSFDAATGRIAWNPSASGPYSFTLRAHNDWGVDRQTWTVDVAWPSDPDAGPPRDAGLLAPDAAGSGRADSGAPAPREPSGDGCGCRIAARSPSLWPLLAIAALIFRRRK